MTETQLKKTPLHSVYGSSAKLVDFGGWEMPIQFYGGILAEHHAVRHHAGLFDVSHMGEITVTGPEAETFLDHLLTNKIQGAAEGQCLYSPMCQEDGGCLDDLLVYVMGSQHYLLVVNATNTQKDFQWIKKQCDSTGFQVQVSNASQDWAQLALQGPQATSLLQPLTSEMNLNTLPYYRHGGQISIGTIPTLISRTGYTGEDGYELYCSPSQAPELWNILLNAGAIPCGLGARDLLRLEARLPLYGHELLQSISPLEAGLSLFVKLDHRQFIGHGALAHQKEQGIPRRLYGLVMEDSGVPREGYPIQFNNQELGVVTSGGKSPSLNRFIALALLQRGSVKVGDTVDVIIRGKKKRATIVKTPFYKRPPSTNSSTESGSGV